MNEIPEVIIGYEDRLRLSELYGQLADAQWMVDNMWIANTAGIIASICFGLLITFIAWVCTYNAFYDEKYRYLLLGIISFLACIIFPIVVVFIIHEFQIHDVMVIQTEIDEILRMWNK